MVLMYTIALTKNKTTIYMKVPYDCLSQKQKMHRGIIKPPTKPCVLVKKEDVKIP
jgi:hypothetical protein